MKVKLTAGSRSGQVIDIPEEDAKKLIKKGHAVSTAKKKAPKKDK